jgi:hypothetical protein
MGRLSHGAANSTKHRREGDDQRNWQKSRNKKEEKPEHSGLRRPLK